MDDYHSEKKTDMIRMTFDFRWYSHIFVCLSVCDTKESIDSYNGKVITSELFPITTGAG